MSTTSSLGILKNVVLASGIIWGLYSFYCYMFPKEKVQSIIPRHILYFKEQLEKRLNLSSKNVLFKYPRVELVAFNFVQPFINRRGYVEHFEISMNESKTQLLCMLKFGTDMQGYLQYIHNGSLLSLLEELKIILLEHNWKQKGQVKTESSQINYLKPLKLHKIYFFLGELVAPEESEQQGGKKLPTKVIFKIIDEKENEYFKSECSCLNVESQSEQ